MNEINWICKPIYLYRVCMCVCERERVWVEGDVYMEERVCVCALARLFGEWINVRMNVWESVRVGV